MFSGEEHGTEVHAGSFLRERRIVLDAALKGNRAELERILAHEIFHFVWWKLGRSRRAEYEALIREEMRRRVRGEMGWSAEWRKRELRKTAWPASARKSREYLCESFCDTAAACLLDLSGHAEITLPAREQARRSALLQRWIGEAVTYGGLRI